MALTDKLSAIGDAIREKTGGTDLLTLDQMPAEISNIQGGGGGEVEPIVLSGACSYACSGSLGSKYIELFGNTISTTNLYSNCAYMFYIYQLKKVPFELNFHKGSTVNVGYMFSESAIEEVPTFNKFNPSNLSSMFNSCEYLRNLPDNFGENWDWVYIHNNRANLTSIFSSCCSLRSIPESFLNNLWSTASSAYSGNFYNSFNSCFSLDEINGLRFNSATMTSNMFLNAFNACTRVKDILFDLEEDGSVQTVQCKSQTIDLTAQIGYSTAGYKAYITNYNSGITADKEVKDDATYQALKDDPDWFSLNINYSRYNHDSAVRTINSLPDTSAYLATKGGTNTIKFRGQSGALTDGGAINTLTEEEIAVATAKGWTVSLV